MASHTIFFVVAKYEGYPTVEPPVTIPVLVNGEKVGLAIYYDSAYTFVVPDELSSSITAGNHSCEYVFANSNGNQSKKYWSGSKVVSISIEEKLLDI
ncbi:MAG: hypothetical protein AB7J13_02040 [Pyrinomonadaceae bacterium]